MKMHFRIVVALAVIILLATIGAAQAAQLSQEDKTDNFINLPILPNPPWRTDYIVTSPNVGTHVSIAIDPADGHTPWISYYNATSRALYVTHFVGASGGNCGPANAWYCDSVDYEFAQTKGLYTSIDIYPDTNPDPLFSTWKVGVSYYDATNKSLKYARYRCTLPGNCSWTIYTVDSSIDPDDDFGQYTSMKFDSAGIPHIAYYVINATGNLLSTKGVKYAYFKGSGDGDCGDNNDWECDFVDSSITNIGLYPSLDIDYENNVYIAYYDAANDSLKYAYYSGIGICGTGDVWYCQVIDDPDGANVGLFPSLHAPQEASDFLRVAYYDITNGNLKYAYNLTGNCGPSGTWQCKVIDYMGQNFEWASISLDLDINQKPMIAYSHVTEEFAPLELNVAVPASVGQPLGTCSGDFDNWYCRSLDNGNGSVDDGQFASLAIKPDGFAMIAYSEQTNDNPSTSQLKLAYQVRQVFLPMILK